MRNLIIGAVPYHIKWVGLINDFHIWSTIRKHEICLRKYVKMTFLYRGIANDAYNKVRIHGTLKRAVVYIR